VNTGVDQEGEGRGREGLGGAATVEEGRGRDGRGRKGSVAVALGRVSLGAVEERL
jgi:hypothetical protein